MGPDEESRSGVTPAEPGPKGPAARQRSGATPRRLAKVEALRARGVNPYPYRFDRDRTLADLRAEYAHLKPGDETDIRVPCSMG